MYGPWKNLWEKCMAHGKSCGKNVWPVNAKLKEITCPYSYCYMGIIIWLLKLAEHFVLKLAEQFNVNTLYYILIISWQSCTIGSKVKA